MEIDGATADARARLVEAETLVAREAERQRVDDVLRHAAHMEEHAKRLDALIVEVVKESTALALEHRQIVRLGVENPSTLTLHAMLNRAFESATIGNPLNRQFISGPARVTFAGLGTNWRQIYKTWALRSLGGEAIEAEEFEPEAVAAE